MRVAAVLLCLAALVWLLLDDGDVVQPVTQPQPDAAPDRAQPGLLGAKGARTAPDATTPPDAVVPDADTTIDEYEDERRVSLRVDAVDGMTGSALHAAWNLGTGNITGAPFPPGVITPEAMARQSKAVEASRAHWISQFRATGEVRPEALDPDGPLDTVLTIQPPAGHVLDDPRPHVRGELAAGARAATFLVPLWREATLDVSVLDAEGQPARDVSVFRLSAAGRVREVTPRRRSPGELRIRGLPHFPGEPVRAVLDWGWGDEEPEEIIEEEIDEGPGLQDAHLVTKMPADLQRPWRVEVRLKSVRGPRFFDSVEIDNDLPYEETIGQSEGKADFEPAALRVRVFGRDWKPAPGAFVNYSRTDAEGYVLLDELRPGSHRLIMRAQGRLGVTDTAVAVAGKVRDVTLCEPEGATLEVLVTDGKGRPRPSAHIEIRGRKVFDVTDGVQRLDMVTDATGRRTFARVQPGKAMLIATWGSRAGARSVTLVDGETKRVTIVAK